MNYLRVDYTGKISVVPDESMIRMLTSEGGHVLVVTGKYERSKVLFEELKGYTTGFSIGAYSDRDMTLSTLMNKTFIRSALDWTHYAGMQFRCAYITPDADLNFLLQIMSRCRMYPEYNTKQEKDCTE